MSIKVMTYVWEYSKHSGSELLMLLAIADHANDEGQCWPSLPRLATRCRVTKRQAINLVQQLEMAGSISIQHGRGRGHCSVYTVKGAKDFTFYMKGETDFTLCQKNGEEHFTISQNKGEIDFTIPEIKGEIQRQKGEIAISPEPSLEPSYKKKNNSLTSFESLSGTGNEVSIPDTAQGDAPREVDQETKKEKRKVRKLAPDDWLWQELQHYTHEFDVDALNDADWWDNVANSFPLFDHTWVPLAFASLAQWQLNNPSNRCRTERGWKKRMNYSLNFYYDKHMRRQSYAQTTNRMARR